MNGRIGVNRLPQIVVAGIVTFGLVATALADSRPSTRSATIAVLADRYIVDDLAFDDLDYLDKHITAKQVHSIELLICGPRTTRPLKAVVHRFRHVAVQMRVADAVGFVWMSKSPRVR